MAKKRHKKKRRLKKPIRIFLKTSLFIFGAYALYLTFQVWQSFSNGPNILEVIAKGISSEPEQESSKEEHSISSLKESTQPDHLNQESLQSPPPIENLEPIATILVDPGHGGIDPGMVASDPGNGTLDIYESELNLQAALEFKECIEEMNPRIRVEMTRQNELSTMDESNMEFDQLTDLNNRIAMVDQYKADYFISLHCNSSSDISMKGYELFIKPNDPVCAILSNYIAAEFEQINWQQGSGVITTDYYPLHVVSLSKIPSILVELGYMTNEEDLSNLVNKESRKSLMRSLAKAYSDCIMANPKCSNMEAASQALKEANFSSNASKGEDS